MRTDKLFPTWWWSQQHWPKHVVDKLYTLDNIVVLRLLYAYRIITLGSSACLIYGLTWKDNTNEIRAFIYTFGADEEHLSTFGCHWDDLLLGLTWQPAGCAEERDSPQVLRSISAQHSAFGLQRHLPHLRLEEKWRLHSSETGTRYSCKFWPEFSCRCWKFGTFYIFWLNRS